MGFNNFRSNNFRSTNNGKEVWFHSLHTMLYAFIKEMSSFQGIYLAYLKKLQSKETLPCTCVWVGRHVYIYPPLLPQPSYYPALSVFSFNKVICQEEFKFHIFICQLSERPVSWALHYTLPRGPGPRLTIQPYICVSRLQIILSLSSSATQLWSGLSCIFREVFIQILLINTISGNEMKYSQL